jgi:hypothetical protein
VLQGYLYPTKTCVLVTKNASYMFRPLRSFPQVVQNCIKRKPATNYVVDIILRRGEEWMELYLISPTRLNYVGTPFLYCSQVCM